MFLQLLLSLAFVLQVSLAKVFLESPEPVRSIRTRAGAPTLQLRRGDAESQERSILARDAAIAFTAPSSTGDSFYTLISAGNISFRVALDTASSDLWLLSSDCKSDVCKKSPTYPLTYNSSTFVSINSNTTLFNISFADGTASSGFVAKEAISFQNLSLVNQTIGLVETTNVAFADEVSGVLGLGFPRLSVIGVTARLNATPFVDGLAQQGLLDYPVFGLSLTDMDSGSLTLGAVDSSVVRDPDAMEWHKVVPFSPFTNESATASYLQWAIQILTVIVNDTRITPKPTYPEITGESLALFDVGTNGIFGPFQDVSRIFDQIPESRLVDSNGFWAVPCDTTQNMSFIFGIQNYTLQPSEYIIGPASGNPNLCLSWPRAIESSGDGLDWHFGTPFLRTVYSAFSYGINEKEPPMIGLYSLSNNLKFKEVSNTSSLVSQMTSTTSATSTTSTTVSTTSFTHVIATTFPNFPLSTPSPSAPPYIFNTSVPALVGETVSVDLGTKSYSPLLAVPSVNASAFPTIAPSVVMVTLVITDSAGLVQTTVTTENAPTPSVKLGAPPGFISNSSRASFSVPPFYLIVLLGFLGLFL